MGKGGGADHSQAKIDKSMADESTMDLSADADDADDSQRGESSEPIYVCCAIFWAVVAEKCNALLNVCFLLTT
jgi:hypothetical protein